MTTQMQRILNGTARSAAVPSTRDGNYAVDGPRERRQRVVCLECEARFATTSLFPECPSCGGSDVEVR